MSLITVAEFTPNPTIHLAAGSTATLRGFYSQRFLDSDESTPVLAGDGMSGFYYEWSCTVDGDGNLVIPEIEIHTTDNGMDVQTSLFTGQLFIDGVPNIILIGHPNGPGWIISATLGETTNWGALDIFNQGRALSVLTTLATYLTAGDTATLIRQLATALIEESALLGSLSANFLPRASTESTLVNSQIQDNGTTVKIDTLNAVEFGDINDSQNGSYISIDDTAGRVSFQAGGDGNAQYAGISAVAGIDQSEFYIQGSAGNGYNYGVFADGVAKLGDGEDENNGTKIVIDDVNEWIKLHNLPTSDPGELNALWKDGADIKISAG